VDISIHDLVDLVEADGPGDETFEGMFVIRRRG
jgi:hypothetical protein